MTLSAELFILNTGIPEDPVTGSAYCCLTPYWAKKLEKEKATSIPMLRPRWKIGIGVLRRASYVNRVCS